MSDRYILNAQGEPVPEPDLLVWAEWFEHHGGDRQLALTKFPDAIVSTIFLGIDHHLLRTDGPPILWETYVLGGSLDGTMIRYATRQDAQAGHDKVCAAVHEALKS